MAKRVRLRAYGNQFVRLRDAGGELFVPPETGPDPWEIFTRTSLGGDRITLRTATARRYVSVENGGLVSARRAVAGDRETFVVVPIGDALIRLRAHDGSYLSAAGGGGDLLLAERVTPGDWETFTLVEAGGSRVALRAFGGQFVRAEAGGGRVVVNRDNREHEVVELDSGTHAPYVAVRASNGRFWAAEGGGYGGGPVLANRETAGGDWAKFGLTNNADGTIALQAKQGRKYVQAENGGGERLLVNGDGIGIWEKFVRTPWFDRPRPRKLLVYDGEPSTPNGPAFSRYEYVILGRGTEETAEVVANVRENTAGVTKVFGSVRTARLSPADAAAQADRWRTMGVAGILLDEFGFEYQTGSDADKRRRQNEIVGRIHALGLPVIVSAVTPADAFDPTPGPVLLTADDFYFAKDYAVEAGEYQPATEWHAKAQKLREYQTQLDFRILSCATGPFDPEKFSYAWHAAMLYAHEAFAWAEYPDSASDAAPFHDRPSQSPCYFTGPQTVSGTAYQRSTDAGTIYVDPINRIAGIR